MLKKGKINTEWRQRLFVLNGKQLSYFKGGVSQLILVADFTACAHISEYILRERESKRERDLYSI